MLFALSFAVLVSANESPNSLFQEKIEVRVGAEIISTIDLRTMEDNLKPLMSSASPAKVQERARDILIEQALIRLHLRRNEMENAIEVEVEKRINAMTSDKNFQALLEAKHTSLDRVRAGLKIQLEKSQFMNLLRRSVTKNPDLNDLKAHFQGLPESSRRNFEVELSECFIPFATSPSEAKQRAEFFIKNPKKFSDCVKEISRSPSAGNGGKIGNFAWGSLPEEIESKVAHLKANEVALIQRPDGIQLLKVEKNKTLGLVTFEMAKDRIREQLDTQILEQEYQKTLADIRANTFIKIQS